MNWWWFANDRHRVGICVILCWINSQYSSWIFVLSFVWFDDHQVIGGGDQHFDYFLCRRLLVAISSFCYPAPPLGMSNISDFVSFTFFLQIHFCPLASLFHLHLICKMQFAMRRVTYVIIMLLLLPPPPPPPSFHIKLPPINTDFL